MFGIGLVTTEHIILKLYDGCNNDMSYLTKAVGGKRQVVLYIHVCDPRVN